MGAPPAGHAPMPWSMRPSFQRLLTAEPDTLTLQLAPGVTCVESAWPVVTLWQAHDPQTAVTLADASQLQQQQVKRPWSGGKASSRS
jgi:hypothetical protein